jgi:hypothetical protein
MAGSIAETRAGIDSIANAKVSAIAEGDVILRVRPSPGRAIVLAVSRTRYPHPAMKRSVANSGDRDHQAG